MGHEFKRPSRKVSSIRNQNVVSVIQAYKDEHGEPPAPMMAVYEYLHKKQIEKTADIRMLQSLYKE